MTLKEKRKETLIEEMLPYLENFLETRESYIKGLEKTIEALRNDAEQYNKNNIAIRTSIDELVAMQRMSNVISVAVSAEQIIATLIDLTKQVIPIIDANIYIIDEANNKFISINGEDTSRLHREAHGQLESGVIDWVISEQRPVIIPDLERSVGSSVAKNFVIVPLILQNRFVGIYIIHSEKSQSEFTNQDILLLSVLANQAAAGVENWRTYEKLEKANEELRGSHSQLIHSSKMAAIGEISAGILHEIRNPLQLIMMHIDSVRKGRAIENWNEIVTGQLKRLKKITKRLTEYSRNISEDLPVEIININNALDELIDLVKPDFIKDGVHIESSLYEKVPPIKVNRDALQQVFLNIMINARDAMKDDGGTLIITTTLARMNVEIRFKDTGHGIDEKDMDKIFKPFFSTKKPGEGTGIGLSISDKIVRRFGGKISVDSAKDKGSVFTVTLPIGSVTK